VGLALNAGLSAKSLEDVARQWAPVFYKDYAHEFTDPSTGFNPVDFPVDLFFDGTNDLRDNDENIFKLDQTQIKQQTSRPTIHYSVIESTTHYYITYIVYHAVDFKAFGHAHDLENVWTVVEKKKSGPDELIAHITNVHGFPMIYSPPIDLPVHPHR
jgi:hypothetical protein